MASLTDQEKESLFKHLLEQRFPDGIEDVRLFGSKALAEPNKFSDIDIWVVTKTDDWREQDPIYPISSDVMTVTDVDLSMHIFSDKNVERMRQTGSPLLRNVWEEGIPL